jgi:hypothetical protein
LIGDRSGRSPDITDLPIHETPIPAAAIWAMEIENRSEAAKIKRKI